MVLCCWLIGYYVGVDEEYVVCDDCDFGDEFVEIVDEVDCVYY